jgi:ribulose-5-phosphate 4-epimerase/fuculose-1-phosphate aldolase
MERTQIKEQLLEGCQRLASKGFLNTPADSFSLRIPGQMEMILISGSKNWRRIEIGDLRTVPFSAKDELSMLHACIYKERGDVGGIAISSPKWVRLLASCGGSLPPIFDEQVRHIGSSASLNYAEVMRGDMVRETFRQGANAVLLDGRLLCLGMTRDRVLFNTELYEKCAQAYVIARACDSRISRIPLWVRLIATRRLLKDQNIASASYRNGRIPEGIDAY